MTPRLELPLQATGRSDESPPLPGQLSKRDSRRFLLLQLALLRGAPFQPRANVGIFLGHEVRLHRRISWRGASGGCGEVTGGQKKSCGASLSRARVETGERIASIGLIDGNALSMAGCIAQAAVSMEDSFANFKRQMLRHAVEAPPDSVAIFTLDEVMQVADFISKRCALPCARPTTAAHDPTHDAHLSRPRPRLPQLLQALQSTRVLLLCQTWCRANDASHRRGDPVRVPAARGSHGAGHVVGMLTCPVVYWS